MDKQYIHEIVVENPHDPVAEFVENYLSKKNTPNNSSSDNSSSATGNRYARPKTNEEVQLARLFKDIPAIFIETAHRCSGEQLLLQTSVEIRSIYSLVF